MSTGIGFGIGIPHASTDLIYEVVGALGRSKGGVNFDALDNQPVNLVMLFLVPQGQFQKHLHTLAEIAKLLHKKEFRRALEESPDAATMYQAIKSQSGTKV
jgi:mannitol/fructose-specific phosphotransferase system IIA component (Ntr-type)